MKNLKFVSVKRLPKYGDSRFVEYTANNNDCNIVLNNNAWNKLVNLISHPPKPSDELIKLFREK